MPLIVWGVVFGDGSVRIETFLHESNATHFYLKSLANGANVRLFRFEGTYVPDRKLKDEAR